MSRRRNPSPPIAEEIEERILYSADLNPLGIDPGQPPVTANPTPLYSTVASASMVRIASPMVEQSEVQSRHELVFIDSGVAGYQDLAKEILSNNSAARSIQVIIIDAGKDGVNQITDALSNYKNLDAIHIVSHGDPGEIQIGSTRLNGDNLLTNAVDVSKWGGRIIQWRRSFALWLRFSRQSIGRRFRQQPKPADGSRC